MLLKDPKHEKKVGSVSASQTQEGSKTLGPRPCQSLGLTIAYSETASTVSYSVKQEKACSQAWQLSFASTSAHARGNVCYTLQHRCHGMGPGLGACDTRYGPSCARWPPRPARDPAALARGGKRPHRRSGSG